MAAQFEELEMFGATTSVASDAACGATSGEEAEDRQSSVSVGSALHGTGECKPCAWYWKPEGCQNGANCLHCHLCPSNAVKARKKQLAQYRKEAEQLQEVQQPQTQFEDQAASQAANQAAPPAAFQAASQAPPPAAPQEPSQAASPLLVPASPAFKAPPGLGLSSNLQAEDSPRKLPYPTLLGAASSMESTSASRNSVGSVLHGTGECKPCAWLWHPKGCENGQACEYCHLCPPGEIKMRRKLKLQGLREATASEHGTSKEIVSCKPSAVPNPSPAQQIQLRSPEMPDIAAVIAEAHAAAQGDALSILESALEPVPAHTRESVGSAEHATGNCRPCAWFWKPEGCQNGKDCQHCHLCPPGELRRKKKEKQHALAQQAAASRQAPRHSGMAPGPKHTRQIRDTLTLQHQVIEQQQQQLMQMQLQLQLQQQMQQQMQEQMQAQFMMATAATMTNPLP